MRKHRIFCFLVGLCLALCFLSQCSLLCANIPAKAATLPSGGHFLTSNETLSFIGNTLTVSYYNGVNYVDTTAYYYSSVSADFTEVSENPVGYVAGDHLWLCYSFSATPYASPDYITFTLNPQYSIFDTEYLYTAFALCRTGGVSTSVYDAPSSDWYIGGTSYHFENNNESASGSGVRSYIDGGYNYNYNCAYIPIMHSQNNRFSAYSLNAKFNGFSGSGTWYFWVMCPYVSGAASGASGTFTTVSGGSSGDININVDLSDTNDLLQDILDGVSPIADLVSILAAPDDIPEAGTVASAPFDNDDYDEMLMTADAILNDIPDTVAAAGFWVELTNAVFPENNWFRLIVPLFMLIALMTWILWKK